MGTGKLHNYLVLSGREFAAGNAEWDGEQVMVGHHVHIAGKEFADAKDDLAKQLDGSPVAAQVVTDVWIADADHVREADELLSTLAIKSGLPHDDIGVVIFDKRTGRPIEPGQDRGNCFAAGFSKRHMARMRADMAALGIPDPVVTIRLFDALGALRASMRRGESQSPVLCAAVMPHHTHLFIVTMDDISDLGTIDYGYSHLLAQVMLQLNLKFEGSAARLFFGNIFDFNPMADTLASPFTEKILCQLSNDSEAKPAGMMICGLPPARTLMLVDNIAAALEISAAPIPVLVKAMEGTGLPTLPPEGAPSLVHMLTCASKMASDTDFFVDLSRHSVEACDYVVPPAEEKIEPQRMYRSVAIAPGEEPSVQESEGRPNTTERRHRHLPFFRGSSGHASKEAPAEKDTPPRRAVRFYRGTPVFEDGEAAENATAETHENQSGTAGEGRRILRYYRGTPIYADD